MSKKLIIPCGNYSIVAEINAINLLEIPVELCVYIADQNNAFLQDICLVRQQYKDVAPGKDFVPIDNAVTCLVWSDSNDECFTHDFGISIYNGEEE